MKKYQFTLITCFSHLLVDIAYMHIALKILKLVDTHARFCNMCSNNDIEDEYHFILECSKYVEIRRKYIKSYYCIKPSAFKLTYR